MSFTKFQHNSIKISEVIYQNILKNILFLVDPEVVHENILSLGDAFGSLDLATRLTKSLFVSREKSLEQKYLGIEFRSPVGLAAGFDYKAKLTQFLPSLGFGFETVGTITNSPYQGNPKPRLGRLPKSKSLMVNKGFKNDGAMNIVRKLKGRNFNIPVGISIGRTNSPSLKTQKQSIQDIVSAFITFEHSALNHSYYELNISCPNLIHSNISFYSPKNLRELLSELDRIKIKRPVFVKMPIEKSDSETLKILEVIAKYMPKGVIFGNLQKDRKNNALYQDEVNKFSMGYFSGKPTFERSNELIKLCYKNYKKRFLIIGCGGVFDGKDAYHKITLGASLIQMITGLVYKGPQLVSQINSELTDLLKKEGFKNISEAIGVNNK